MFVTRVEHPIGSLISTTALLDFPEGHSLVTHSRLFSGRGVRSPPFRGHSFAIVAGYVRPLLMTNDDEARRLGDAVDVCLSSLAASVHCCIVGCNASARRDRGIRSGMSARVRRFLFFGGFPPIVICVFVCHVYCRYCYIGNNLIEFWICIVTEFGQRCQIFFIEIFLLLSFVIKLILR